ETRSSQRVWQQSTWKVTTLLPKKRCTGESTLQRLRILDNYSRRLPCTRDRVIQKPALRLGVAAGRHRPKDQHAIEFAIFCLVDGHRARASRPARQGAKVLDAAADAAAYFSGNKGRIAAQALAGFEPMLELALAG